MGNRRGENWLDDEAERISDRRSLMIAAHNAAGLFISELASWNCVMTGTYDPRKRLGASEKILGVKVAPRVSRWKALRDAERLYEFSTRLVGSDVPAVICVEPHLDRSYHLHGVLELSTPSRAVLGALKWWWSERYGFCHFDAVRRAGGVSSYVGKHLTGPSADLWFSPALHPHRESLSEGAKRGASSSSAYLGDLDSDSTSFHPGYGRCRPEGMAPPPRVKGVDTGVREAYIDGDKPRRRA